MIEPHVQKIVLIDAQFLQELENQSITGFREFQSPRFDTKVITLPVPSIEISDLTSRMHPSDIRPGGVMVKARFSDQFVSVDSFTEDCAVSKYRVWVRLCLALGAKTVRVSNIEEVSLELESGSSMSATLAGTAPMVDGEASFNNTARESHKQARQSIMQLNATAEGSAPNLVEAKRILEQYGLLNDEMFQSIYDMRSVSSNPVIKHEFSLDMTSDMKRVLDASFKAKIKIMGQLYSGRAGLETVKESLEKGESALRLSVSVEF